MGILKWDIPAAQLPLMFSIFVYLFIMSCPQHPCMYVQIHKSICIYVCTYMGGEYTTYTLNVLIFRLVCILAWPVYICQVVGVLGHAPW